MRFLCCILVSLIAMSMQGETQRKLYSGRHEGVIGKVSVILHGKQKIKIGERNRIELRGVPERGKTLTMVGSGLSVSKSKKDGFYIVKPSPSNNLFLLISLRDTETGQSVILKRLNVRRFTDNKWDGEE